MSTTQYSWETNPHLLYEQRVLLSEWQRKGHYWDGSETREATPEFLEGREALFTADNIKDFLGGRMGFTEEQCEEIGQMPWDRQSLKSILDRIEQVKLENDKGNAIHGQEERQEDAH